MAGTMCVSFTYILIIQRDVTCKTDICVYVINQLLGRPVSLTTFLKIYSDVPPAGGATLMFLKAMFGHGTAALHSISTTINGL